MGAKVRISKKTKCVGFSTVGEALNGDQAKVLYVCKNERSVIIYSPFTSFQTFMIFFLLLNTK